MDELRRVNEIQTRQGIEAKSVIDDIKFVRQLLDELKQEFTEYRQEQEELSAKANSLAHKLYLMEWCNNGS